MSLLNMLNDSYSAPLIHTPNETFSQHYKVICLSPFQWGVTPLIDNQPQDRYYYLVTVSTAMRPEAGTKSKVAFVLGGEECDTGIRVLDDGIRRVSHHVTNIPANICITFVQCWTNVEDIGPTLYKWYHRILVIIIYY